MKGLIEFYAANTWGVKGGRLTEFKLSPILESRAKIHPEWEFDLGYRVDNDELPKERNWNSLDPRTIIERVAAKTRSKYLLGTSNDQNPSPPLSLSKKKRKSNKILSIVVKKKNLKSRKSNFWTNRISLQIFFFFRLFRIFFAYVHGHLHPL